jgi:uncharacterized protein (TIGR02145 family)
MKLAHNRYFLLLFLVIASLTQCKDDETIKTPPVASFKLTPTSGLTTTVFSFDVSASKATNTGDTILFIRWDWDNDNIWDTGFSRSKFFTHRYYKPGDYFPRMEIRNETGQSDTTLLTVQVGRGYSAPLPSFTLLPGSGNLRTEFVFNAQNTRDDEDSLNTLKFRWDWEGDGIFDTDYSEQTLISHLYSSSSIYNPVLEVIDPKGLTATLRKTITVSTSNLRLIPQYSWSPEKPTTSDTVLLDASASYDPDNVGNTFTYRWNFMVNAKDVEFDTEYMTNPIFGHQFQTEGDNSVVLEIRDQWGLINQVKSTIYVGHSNLKPTASFFIGYEYGDLTTSFYLDADASTDREDMAAQLKVRWDFESDGIWDTEYNKERTATHKYSGAGSYHVRMQILDSGGLTDTTGHNVYVSSGTNETGLILDKAKSISYGSVKIGSQWWMSENLNEPGKVCYSNLISNCNLYGGLYTWTIVMNGVTTEKAKGLCPTGWHVPTVTEWQTLMDYYTVDTAKNHLLVGGDSDFRMFFAGQRSTAGRSEMMNLVANFWTSTKSSGDNAWAFSFQKDQNNYFKINLGQAYGFSVRCIKD